MFLRALFFLAAFGFAISAAAVFDAAACARQALAIGAAARDARTPELRAEMAQHARALLENSWSRPLLWHAGALEALSWVEALASQEDPARAGASIAAAERGLRASPVQPIAWARLAAFSQPNNLCAPQACLDHSWRAAKMAAPDFACARLTTAHSIGALDPIDRDERALWYAMSAQPRDAAHCVRFAPSDQIFRLLLQRRSAVQERP